MDACLCHKNFVTEINTAVSGKKAKQTLESISVQVLTAKGMLRYRESRKNTGSMHFHRVFEDSNNINWIRSTYFPFKGDTAPGESTQHTPDAVVP